MIGHLGSRVSALLDGQLGPEETERAWAHVHTCHACRDQVEREGWVKTRLATMSANDQVPTPAHLKGSLLGGLAFSAYDGLPAVEGRRRTLGLAALGGGAAVGAAVMGILALGAAPADAPGMDRRLPTMTPASPAPAPAFVPARRLP